MDDYWLWMNQGAVIFYRWCQNEQVHWLFTPDPDLLVVPVSWSPTPCFVLDFLALIYRQHIDKAPLKEGGICIERLLKHCCHSRPILTVLLSDKVLAPWTHITRRCNHRDVWKKKNKIMDYNDRNAFAAQWSYCCSSFCWSGVSQRCFSVLHLCPPQ